MLKKSLLLVLILFLSGCVGTMRIAGKNSGVNSKDLNTAIHTKSSLIELKN